MTSFCLICYKEFLQNGTSLSEISPNKNTSHVLHKFVKQLFRNMPSSIDDSEYIAEVCATCSIVLKQYCGLQLELECVQMKIQWQLRRLKILMHQAGRVPKRIENFRKNVFIKFENQEEQIKTVLSLRQKVYNICSKKVKRLDPVVRLSLQITKPETRCKDERNLELQENGYHEVFVAEQNHIDNFGSEIAEDDVSSVKMFQENLRNPVGLGDEIYEHNSAESQNESVIETMSFLNDDQTSPQPSDTNVLKKRLRAVFKCSNCQRTFSSQANLEKHETEGNCKIANLDESEEDASNRKRVKETKIRKQIYNQMEVESDSDTDASISDANSYDSASSHNNTDNNDDSAGTTKTLGCKQMFPCPIKQCTLLFKQEIHLQLHMKIHGEFSCIFCDFKTDQADKFWNHEISEHACKPNEPNKFQCSRCSKIFSKTRQSKRKAKLHFFTEHLKIDYYNGVCPKCDAKFVLTTETLERAIKRHQQRTSCITDNLEKRNDNILRCSKENCNQVFKYKEGLKMHLKLHGNFNCQFCEFQTNLADKLLEHEWSSHTLNEKDSTKVKCSRCPVEFSNLKSKYNVSHINKHFFREHLNIPYEHAECSICGYKFASTSFAVKWAIERHMKQHNVEGRDPSEIFTCDICNAPFITDQSLRSHKFKVHKVSTLNCPICSKTFRKGRDVTEHVKTVHKSFESDGAKYFRCPVEHCDKMFLHKFSLDGHMTRHKGKMIMCDECGKWAMDETAMKGHMVIHNRSKNPKTMVEVICELCGKKFQGKTKSDAETKLQLHLRTKIHSRSKTGELVNGWEFACELCGKLCNTFQKLEEHIRIHTKEQPFLCNVCGREFSINWNLKRHMKLVHEKANNNSEQEEDNLSE